MTGQDIGWIWHADQLEVVAYIFQQGSRYMQGTFFRDQMLSQTLSGLYRAELHLLDFRGNRAAGLQHKTFLFTIAIIQHFRKQLEHGTVHSQAGQSTRYVGST